MPLNTRRILALVISFVMCMELSLVGTPAWATEGVNQTSPEPTGQTNLTDNLAGGQEEGNEGSVTPSGPTQQQGNENLEESDSDTDSSDNQNGENEESSDEDASSQDEVGNSEDGEKDDPADIEAEDQKASVSVLTHVQRQGWANDWVTDGNAAGTTGQRLRLEAFRLRVDNQGETSGSIQYRSHVQREGWQGWATGDAVSGSIGKARRVEAIQIKLTEELEQTYDVYYRVHAQRYGWMGWAKNGETAGTAGLALRIESMQVVLVEKDGDRPSDAGQNTSAAFIGTECVGVSAHVQRIGWMGEVGNGQVAGTNGRGLRMEAVRASLKGARVPGGVEVSTHVQGIGWMGWSGNGQVAGTTGRGKRMEAIKMHLTGEAASTYDLYYRVHVQKVGWLSWAREDEAAGSEGLALRAEAIQTMLVPEGAAAPSNSDAAYSLPFVSPISIGTSSFVSDSWQGYAWNGNTSGTTGQKIPNQGLRIVLSGADASVLGGVSYRVHVQGGGWQEWVANGADAGVGNRVDAFQVQLSGTAAKVYNVCYRAHAQSYGWMGWAKNGQSAGTVGLNKRLEAVQVMLVPKTRSTPGSATGAFFDGTLRSGLDAANGARALSGFGGYRASSGVVNGLNRAINDLRGRGYDVGFIMMDLSSHKGVAYNCDALFYGASSIKAPYIGSVVSAYPDSVTRYAHDMTETLFYSWDYNYKNVLAAYGKGPMYTWCSEAGVRSAIADELPWATYSARELAKMWARMYQLFQQGGAGEQLGRWCEQPNVSTIHSTLSGRYRTRSKAGWIDAGGAVIAGVNGGGQFWRVSDDGGIVYASNGAYVVAIMSSVPANHPMLNGLTSAIDAAHQEM